MQQRSVAGLAGVQFEWRASFDMRLITLGKGSLVEFVRFVRKSVAGQSFMYFMLAEVSLYSRVNENKMLIFKLLNSVYCGSSNLRELRPMLVATQHRVLLMAFYLSKNVSTGTVSFELLRL